MQSLQALSLYMPQEQLVTKQSAHPDTATVFLVKSAENYQYAATRTKKMDVILTTVLNLWTILHSLPTSYNKYFSVKLWRLN